MKDMKKILAAVMAFAMVLVGGSIIIGFADTDAATGDFTVLPATTEMPDTLGTSDTYKVAASDSATVGESGTSTIYLKAGSILTITGATGSSQTITVYLYKTDASDDTDKYMEGDFVVTIDDFTSGTMTITGTIGTDSTHASQFVIGGTASATIGNSATATGGKIGFTDAGFVNTRVSNTIINNTIYSAVSKIKASTGSNVVVSYYGNGTTAKDLGSVTIVNTDEVVICKGSAVVTEGTNKVTLSNVTSTAGITVTGGASNPAIKGALASGSITIDSGKFIVDTGGFSQPSTGGLNAFAVMGSSGSAPTATAISATTELTGKTSDQGNNGVIGKYLFVYGDVASNQTITTIADKAVVTFNANITALTVKILGNSWIMSIDGTATITESSGEMSITGLPTTLTLVEGNYKMGNLTVAGTLTVSTGAVLDITANVASVTGAINVYGTITSDNVETKRTITLTAKATGSTASEFRSFDGSIVHQSIEVALGATGGSNTVKGIISIASSTKYVNGTTTGNETYYQSQDVVVLDYYDIKSNSTVNIYGSFEVPEGTTVTIYSGSSIVINGDTSVVKIAGKVVVESGANFTVNKSKNVEVTGTVESEGTLTFTAGTFEIKNGGIVDSQGTFIGTSATVGAGSDLKLTGIITSGVAIKNAGTITLDEVEFGGAVTVSNIASGAVVKIVSYEAAVAGTLTINDSGMEYNGSSVTVNTNSFVLTAASGDSGAKKTGYSGITVTSSVVLVGFNNTPTNKMDIAGTVNIYNPNNATTLASPSIVLNGNGATISGELTLGEKVVVTTSETGTDTLSISGTLTAIADNSSFTATTGKVTVTGIVTLKTAISATTNVNAAYYKTKDASDVTIHNYSTLSKAIEAGATDIKTYGTITVSDSIDVPTGTTVDVNGTINIGSTTSRDVKVAFANGAIFKVSSGTVNVDGTLEFENKKDNRASTIISDVSVIGEVASKYTNIYTALGAAEEGDVITITKQSAVVIDSDITVKDGVTLSVPAGKSVTINNNVTVTVDGTVISYSGFGAQNVFGVKEETNKSALVVNGKFMTGESGGIASIQSTYKTYGAYYVVTTDIGTYTYIAPLTVAVEDAQAAGTLTVYGENKFSSVKVDATQSAPVTIIFATDSVTDGDFEISNYVTINADANSDVRYDGTITSAVGEIDIVNMKGFIIKSELDSDKNEILAVYKTPVQSATAAGNPDKKFTVVSGVVTSPGTAAASNKFVATGAGLSISADSTLRVTGAMDVGNLTIKGTLEVANEATLSSSGYVQVSGALIIADAVTDKALGPGTATIETLYVGISQSSVGAAATVSAPAINNLAKVYLAAGSTISEDLLTGLTKSTKFTVDGSDYMTVFTNTEIDIYSIKVPAVDGAEVTAWQYVNSSGKLTSITSAGVKNVGDISEVSGKMKFDVYKITFLVDSGVSDIYIDGVLIGSSGISGSDDNIYITAGSHQVTYKLKAGYGGDITVTFNGEKATNGKFTISTDMPFKDGSTHIEYKIVVSGAVVEDVPTPEPTPVEPTEKDDSMGITEYLLIVLVVLAAILVVVVAIRMMRS